jgi:hypothetical protein
MRTPEQALSLARRYTTCRVGMCLWTVQEWYGAPHAFPSAWSQWTNSRRQHPGDRNPPEGVPVLYAGGRHGHIALSTGRGTRSTDAPTNGQVAEVDLDWPLRRWGHHYLGWIGDLGGQVIPSIGDAPPCGYGSCTVHLAKLRSGQHDSDSVRILQQTLNAHRLAPPGDVTLPITGYFGPKTEQVVIACQVQHGFGHDRPGQVFVGPRQAAHLGLPGIRT